jgi:LysR family nitrogen assimilation transcriptional regulator
MELSQLRTLIHVAELGSLSKAADRLHIAQPALSRQVRLLEEELGVRLFARHGRGMVLTEQGQEILKHATRVMTELRDDGAGGDPRRHLANRRAVAVTDQACAGAAAGSKTV